MLIRSKIPVYNVTTERRPPKVWFRETERLSAEDVNRLRQTNATSANQAEVLAVERPTEPSASKSGNDQRENIPDIAANILSTEQQRPEGSEVRKRRPEATPIPTTSSEVVNAELVGDEIEESNKDGNDDDAMVSATSIIRVAKETAISDSNIGKGKGKGKFVFLF